MRAAKWRGGVSSAAASVTSSDYLGRDHVDCLIRVQPEELLQRRDEVPEDSPCRYSSSTSETFGDLRHHGGRILEENRIRSPVAASTRLSCTGGALNSTGPVAVATVRA